MAPRAAMTAPAATVVLAVDGSPASLQAARLLAAYEGAPERIAVVVLNAQPRPLTVWPMPSLDVGAIDSALEERGRVTLAPAASLLTEHGLAPRTAVRLEPAVEAIVNEITLRDAQAVVMGTRGHGPLGGYAIGSVALRVVHRAHVPVVLVKPDTAMPAALGRSMRLLVPTDGSVHALRAVTTALKWRAWLGDIRVDLVHVEEPITLAETLAPPHGDVLRQWSGSLAERATHDARAALEAAGVPLEAHAITGDPAARIAEFAAERASDLIVMGTRGRGAVHHALVGSVALKTAHASRAPVALVP